jgi:DNA polymerase III sliding clamp (beta) subunit (PCNA family)
MRFSAPASALTAAIAMTAPAHAAIKLKTDRKPPPDVQVHIVAGGNVVTFVVTNVRAGITISASSAAKVTEPGEASTSASRLNALLAAFTPGSAVEISTDGSTVHIDSAKSTYRLPSLPETPSTFTINKELGRVELPRVDVLRLLEVLPAAGTEQTRLMLCGAFWHNVEGELVSVACDGTQLLRVGVAAAYFSDDQALIIPAPAAAMARRLLRQATTDVVTVRRSRGLLSITAPGCFELVTALVAAVFPDYRGIMPIAAGNSTRCQRAELLGALSRLKAVAADNLVRLSWREGSGELLLSLPRQPGIGADTLAARTCGSGCMVFDMLPLSRLIAEFNDEAIDLDVTDRALLIQQREKTGVLACCNWHDAAASEPTADHAIRRAARSASQKKSAHKESNHG